MALQRYSRGEKKPIQRSEFHLIGEVIRETEKDVLIKKLNVNNTFGIEKPTKKQWSTTLEKGKTYCFIVTISTYLDKSDVIRTKIRGRDVYEYDTSDITEDTRGFLGIKEGTIEDVIMTDIASLKIVKFKRDGGETFYLRFFSDKDPVIGECKVELDLRSTTKLIDGEGNVWEDPYTYINKDGKEVQANKWFPSLEIKEFID